MKDQNTKYFHAATTLRKKKQEIEKIKIDNRVIEGAQNIKEKVRDFFVGRFKEEEKPDFDFNLDNHSKLTGEQAQHLERLPSREEIKKCCVGLWN